jgi:hypothetical protein
MIMKKRLLVSALVAGSSLVSGWAMAQEVGNVISSTPVLKRVTEPRSSCVNEADGRQRCTTQMVTEDRTIGYKVVYEYAGKQRTVQLPFPPGATIPLEISPAGPTGYALPDRQTISAPTPVYSSESQPVVVERVVREPVVYVERDYYPGPYYRNYYYDPIVPIVGLALGATALYYGTRWNHGGWGHYGYRGGFRHR